MATKEVAKKEDTSVANASMLASQPVFDASDIEIPRMQLTQPMSDLVTDGTAKPGEFRDSIDGTLLGTMQEPVEVILVSARKYWRLFTREGSARVYQGQEPVTLQNANAPIVDGVNERDKVFDYFLLVTDGSEAIYEAIPYVFSFSRSSFRVAKKLNATIMRLSRQKKSMSSVTFKFGVSKVQNDKGTFFVPTVEVGRDTNKAELECAAMWSSDLNAGKVKVAEESNAETGNEDQDIPF